MAPSKIDDGGLSEYELMRMKNMEENRRILESIRREQVIKILLKFAIKFSLTYSYSFLAVRVQSPASPLKDQVHEYWGQTEEEED